MDDKGRRISEMTTRMVGFKVMKEDDFPAASVAGQRFSDLSALKTKLDKYGSKWKRERRAASSALQKKAEHVERANRQMKRIRDTAVSCEPQQPGISLHFDLPASKSAESVMEAARACLEAATPLKPLFLSREMKENFLEKLAETIQSYEEAVKDFNLHDTNASGAKTMFEGVSKEVMAVRRELDPMVRNKYMDDPETLAQWETARHLEQPAKRSTPDEPGDGNQPPPDGQN